ncbi:MAG TPA: ABC transporter ATP-binding protein [Isosphaeraceae bacterium]|nr:ABC transporter ATP-binding protein [Isosphaeraceae bacterium]
MAQIELHQVSKAFAPGAPALDRVDLVIAEGERMVVLGPSGSGKTTLLRLIAGLETPDAGTIRIGGRDMAGVPPHRRDVSMVFQNPALYPHLSVFENLAFGLRARGVARDERRRRVHAVAEMLGVGRLLDRRPAGLSGGERQRVALGRAMVREPRVLLLDEPFSNLDDPLRAALRGELVKLHRRFGSTVVHVTHDQSEALSIGQRLAVVHGGRIIQVDTPGGIYERPAQRFVASFVGSPGMNLVACEVVLGETTLQIRPCGGEAITYPLWVHPQDAVLPLHEPVRLELGVRPGSVILSGETLVDPADCRYPFAVLPAIVRGVEFEGGSWLVTLQADGQTLLSRSPLSRLSREGQRVVAHLELWRASWFDPATGRRVELHCQPSLDAIA